jgi:hypothetical protein
MLCRALFRLKRKGESTVLNVRCHWRIVLARRDGCMQIAFIFAGSASSTNKPRAKRAATDFDSVVGRSRYNKDIMRLTRRGLVDSAREVAPLANPSHLSPGGSSFLTGSMGED